ncbi:MAG: ethylbenzene dehydrogenase-related protein [Myxococcota bacterium]
MRVRRVLAWGCGALLLAIGATADTPNWSEIEGREVVLFYPGRSSWEWMLTKSDHSGGPKIRKGKHCQGCHEGEEADIALDRAEEEDGTAASGPPNVRATIPVNVKFAQDDERLYVRLGWPGGDSAGETQMDPETEARVAMMIGTDDVKGAKVAGCWVACHDDLPGMASAREDRELTKYLTPSRTRIGRSGGGEDLKTPSELETLLTDGAFMEYWQARLNRDQPSVAVDGYVLEARHESDDPAVTSEASFEDGRWVAVLSRPLVLSRPEHNDLLPGTVYTVGFAIHDDHSKQRFHHVSLEHTFALEEGPADFVAARP